MPALRTAPRTPDPRPVVGSLPIKVACASERSAANASRAFAGSIVNSVPVPLSVGYGCGTNAVPSTLSFDAAVTSPSFSPSSGAKAATKTKPTTFGAPVAALLITAPPYECPTASTRPGIWANRLATYALSWEMPRSGLAAATTW